MGRRRPAPPEEDGEALKKALACLDKWMPSNSGTDYDFADHWQASGIFKIRRETVEGIDGIPPFARDVPTLDLDDRCARDWLQRALRGDAEADLVLRGAAVALTARRLPLPELIAGYVAEVLFRKPCIPKGLSKRLNNAQRDMAICMTIHELVDGHGLHATRNSATTGRDSACAIVCAALAERRQAMDEKAVQQIWRRKRNVKAFASMGSGGFTQLAVSSGQTEQR